MRCLLFLTYFVAVGLATHHESRCPRLWIGNPFGCNEIACGNTEDCVRLGATGLCCRTTCGGQNCIFKSDRIVRAAPSANLPVEYCPLAPWGGQSSQQCSRHECSSNKECVRNGVQGRCCVTRCGGFNCHFAQDYCPVRANWTGLSTSFCSEEMCTLNQDCRKNDIQGVCCQTSCGGRNCFFANSTLPTSEVTHKSKRKAGEFYYSCPPKMNYVGISAKKCSQVTCSHHSNCGEIGLCCRTKCGGKACFIPKIPVPTQS